MPTNVCIVYISPNGSTGKVAKAFADQLSQDGATVRLVDLADSVQIQALLAISRLSAAIPGYGRTAGDGIYSGPPPVSGAWAVPFVTYGRACSGVALWQMATALKGKGFEIAGAAKVVAVHSMMWQADVPEGAGHPDADDLQQVREMAGRTVVAIFSRYHDAVGPGRPGLSTRRTRRGIQAQTRKALDGYPQNGRWGCLHPMRVCADQCPAGAIALNPLPEFGPACFDCFNCVRLCPEAAISPPFPMADIEAKIRTRVKNINEQPLTRTFPDPRAIDKIPGPWLLCGGHTEKGLSIMRQRRSNNRCRQAP